MVRKIDQNKLNKLSWSKIGTIVSMVAIIISIYIGWPKKNVPDFLLSVDYSIGDVEVGGSLSTPVHVKGVNEYDDVVTLSTNIEPFTRSVVCSFAPRQEKSLPNFDSTLTIVVSSEAIIGEYKITITGKGSRDNKEHSVTYYLTIKNSRPRSTPITLPTHIPTSTPTDTLKPTPTVQPSPTISYSFPINVNALFVASGFMGDITDIDYNDGCMENPHSGSTCIKIVYTPNSSHGKNWVGIYWLYPENNFGNMPEYRNLTGVTSLSFYARGKEGGEIVEFKVGGISGKYRDSISPPLTTDIVALTRDWQEFIINLSDGNMSHIMGGFCWVTNKNQNQKGCTIYLDDMIFR